MDTGKEVEMKTVVLMGALTKTARLAGCQEFERRLAGDFVWYNPYRMD